MGNILFSLFVRFGLIYKIWALVLVLYLGDVIKGLLLVLGPLLLILPLGLGRVGLGRVGLRAYFLNSITHYVNDIYIYIYIYIYNIIFTYFNTL